MPYWDGILVAIRDAAKALGLSKKDEHDAEPPTPADEASDGS